MGRARLCSGCLEFTGFLSCLGILAQLSNENIDKPTLLPTSAQAHTSVPLKMYDGVVYELHLRTDP